MQPLRRVILATLPTMIALLGFMWFRRKKKAPIIKDMKDAQEEKGVPLKKNNNVDGKASKGASHHNETKKKNSVNFSLEDNIVISPVSTVKAAVPSNKTTPKSQESSEVPKSLSHIDKVAKLSYSHVSEHQSVASSAPKCHEKVSQSPVLHQEKICDSSSNSTIVKSTPLSTTADVPPSTNLSPKLEEQSNAQSLQKHQEGQVSCSEDTVVKSCSEDTVVKSSVEVSHNEPSSQSLRASDSSDAPKAIEKSNKQFNKIAVNEEYATDVKEQTKTAEAVCEQVVESVLQDEQVQEAAQAQVVALSNEDAKEVQVEEKVTASEASVTRTKPDMVKQTASVSDDAEDKSCPVVAETGHELLSNGCSGDDSQEEVMAKCDVSTTGEKVVEEESQESEAQVTSLENDVKSEKAEILQEESSQKLEETCYTLDDSSKGISSESVKPLEPQTNGIDHTDHQNGLHSDSHSEVSSDSGKGNSVGETPQTTSPTVDVQEYSMYEFDFPSNLCGRLIGRYGKNINAIKDKTGADIFLKSKPFVKHYQICCIQGTHSQVNAALSLIKKRFPPEYFEDITYEQLNSIVEQPVLTPEIMQLSLPEGVSVDVIVSSVVDVSHVFLQQPTHPTFSCLERLNYCMNACYSQDGIVPQLPRPIEVGVICAAPMYNGWYRAQVVDSHADTDEYDIKFVDYGGYVRVQGCQLRQIRSDFTTLPFQAVECYVSNLVPPEGQEAFPPEASPVLENLVQGKILQAQIVANEEDGVPYVQLYEVQGDQAVFINREIVNQNVAQWMEFSS